MGILRFVEEEAVDCFFDAGTAPEMESFILTPPGTAAASRPPPVAARNRLRSTDLPPRELSILNPLKVLFLRRSIAARGIIRLLSIRGSHKIVFGRDE